MMLEVCVFEEFRIRRIAEDCRSKKGKTKQVIVVDNGAR